MSDGCLAADAGCRGPIPDDAPVRLCAGHLAAVAEWQADHDGAVDLLPMPCRVCGSRLGVRFPSGWMCAVCEWAIAEVPDGELPPPRLDVVYYLRYADRVKIGTTANPRQRLAAIRHDELLAFERGDRLVEARRHAQFGDLRHPRTEWFRYGDALRRHVEVLRAGVDDPWRLHRRWRSELLAVHG